MDRTELTLAVAGALAAAVFLGWLLGIVTARLNTRAGARGAAEARDLVRRLQDAERARRTAETRAAVLESDLGARLAAAEAEVAETQESLERERARSEEFRAAHRETTQGRAG
jgi:hypothetical protein